MADSKAAKVVEVVAETTDTVQKNASKSTAQDAAKAVAQAAKAAAKDSGMTTENVAKVAQAANKAAEQAAGTVEASASGTTKVVRKSVLKFVEETPFRKKVAITVAAATLTTGAILVLAKLNMKAKDVAEAASETTSS
jgi:hypothetical protein